jgi:large subunit ribosomal protein L27
MAHKKAAGSTSLGRESESKRLGVKLTDGEWAKTGAIIIRQRGTKYHPGLNVKRGGDDTLFAMKGGFVKFTTKKLRKFNNTLKTSKIVNVLPQTEAQKVEQKATQKAATVAKAAKKATIKRGSSKKPANQAAAKKTAKK